MKQQKNSKTKKTLLSSIIVLIVCIAMLLGTTFAWFSDSVSNTGNKIQAGTLDIDLLKNSKKTADAEGTYVSIADNVEKVFSADVLWEPGQTQVAYLAVQNKGNLALKYNLYIDVTDKQTHEDLTKAMAEAFEFVVVKGEQNGKAQNTYISDWADAKTKAGTAATNLYAALGNKGSGRILAAPNGCLNTQNEADYFAIVLHMSEEAGNAYQAGLIEVDVNIIATQQTYEKDGFNSDQYDANAVYPALAPYINEIVTKENGNFVIDKDEGKNQNYAKTGSQPITVESSTSPVTSTVPASTNLFMDETGAKDKIPTDNVGDDGTEFQSNLSRTIKTTDATETSVSYDISYIYSETVGAKTNVYNVTGFSAVVENIVSVSKGLKDVKVTHSHGSTVTQMVKADNTTAKADNTYYYDSANGKLYIWSKLYSNFKIEYEYDFVSSVGSQGYTSLDEALAAAEAGQTVLLLKDADLTGHAAYAHYVYNIKDNVTINLNNHTITSNNYGVVYQGKNLTIKNGSFAAKDGGSYALFVGDETATTGVKLENLTCTGGINVYKSAVTIRNCNVTGTKYYAVWADDGAVVSIESGNYTSPSTEVGTATAVLAGTNGSISITGGTYGSDPSAYVASGYVATKNGDVWTVGKIDYSKYFAGGKGTQAEPYLIKTAEQLLNIDYIDLANNPTAYFRLDSDIVLGQTGLIENEGDYYYMYRSSNQPLDINLNDHTISNIKGHLFYCASSINLYSGELNFNATTGASVAYSVTKSSPSTINMHDLVLSGNIKCSSTHFGPLVCYAYGRNTANQAVTINLDKIVNNLTIINEASGNYTGGFLGYVQGPYVEIHISNSSFNGYMQAVKASAFINDCCRASTNTGYKEINLQHITSTGNSLNGTLVGTTRTCAFGGFEANDNGNIDSVPEWKAAWTDSVTLGANAKMINVAPSTNLLKNNLTFGDEIEILNSAAGAVRYVVFLNFWIKKNGISGGFPSAKTATVNVTDSFNGKTGLYVLEIKDGTSETGSPMLTRTGNYYYYYDEDCSLLGSWASPSISVFAYDANGKIVAHQHISFDNIPKAQ